MRKLTPFILVIFLLAVIAITFGRGNLLVFLPRLLILVAVVFVALKVVEVIGSQNAPKSKSKDPAAVYRKSLSKAQTVNLSYLVDKMYRRFDEANDSGSDNVDLLSQTAKFTMAGAPYMIMMNEAAEPHEYDLITYDGKATDTSAPEGSFISDAEYSERTAFKTFLQNKFENTGDVQLYFLNGKEAADLGENDRLLD